MSIIPVENIVGFQPTQAQVGQETKLEGTMYPADATHPNIRWSVISGNATIVRKPDGDYILPHSSELVRVRATITNEKLQ